MQLIIASSTLPAEHNSTVHSTASSISVNRLPHINRGVSSWINDYVVQRSIYPERMFKRRFAVPRALYYYIKDYFLGTAQYIWEQRSNGYGKVGPPTDSKLLVCFCLLSTGYSIDSFDDAARMSETPISNYFVLFIIRPIRLNGPTFLNRTPTNTEMSQIDQR